MKHIIFSLLLVTVIALYSNFRPAPVSLSSGPVIIAELFTSEGCSSCPAADRLLNEIVQASVKNSKPVVGISFHVTYWNHLGWKDPYSKELFTTRQKKYVERWHLGSPYTPMAVVNGTHEFVGSDRKAFEQAIKFYQEQAPHYTFNVDASLQDNEVNIRYTLDRNPGQEWLNIVFVESHVKTYVERGENHGKELEHYNVARKLISKVPSRENTISVKIPKEINPDNGSVILFIQDPVSLEIRAASRINLKPATTP